MARGLSEQVGSESVRSGPGVRVDRELSQRIAEAVHARRGDCWRGAWRAQARPELRGCLYVEGWAVAPDGRVFGHGWLEFDGKVVDSVLWAEDLAYFACLRLDREQLKRALEQRHEFPLASWLGRELKK
jgi:hypothetical protein